MQYLDVGRLLSAALNGLDFAWHSAEGLHDYDFLVGRPRFILLEFLPN
jgi:hypothetical protein